MTGAPRRLRGLFAESYPQARAGQQRTLAALLAAWTARGHAATVVAPADGPVRGPCEAAGATFAVLPPPARLTRYGGAVYRDGAVGKALNAAASARYALAARRFLARTGPDVLFCNDARGWLAFGPAAKLTKVHGRRVPVAHWDKLDKPHGRGGWLDRLELPLCDRVLFITDAVRAKFPPAQLARYADRCATVHNGIDPAPFDPATDPAAAPDRAGLGLADGDFVVLQVGTVNARKGVDRALAALPALLERVPHAVLAFAGEPGTAADAAWRDGLPHAGHPRVRWLGRRGDVPAVLNAADVVVLPSRHEGMGRALVEAMAARRPCVGSDAGGIPEVIDHGATGFVVNFRDESAGSAELARRLADLAADPDLPAKPGRSRPVPGAGGFSRPHPDRKSVRRTGVPRPPRRPPIRPSRRSPVLIAAAPPTAVRPAARPPVADRGARRPPRAPARRVRIAHVQLLPMLSGVQRVALDELQRLDPAVFDRTLILQSDGPFADAARAAGCAVQFAPALARAVRPAADLRAYRQLKTLLSDGPVRRGAHALLEARRAGPAGGAGRRGAGGRAFGPRVRLPRREPADPPGLRRRRTLGREALRRRRLPEPGRRGHLPGRPPAARNEGEAAPQRRRPAPAAGAERSGRGTPCGRTAFGLPA